MQTKMLIDGHLQAGNGELLPVYNPAREAVSPSAGPTMPNSAFGLKSS